MARILFIDDDAGGRQMACFNLTKAGHSVDEADTGQAGLLRFDPDAHDLVITDVRMPGLSGIEVTRRIRLRSDETPILVITAFGNIETAVEAMRAGAHDFVLKPFNREQLLLAVERALGHRDLTRENRRLRRQLRGIERPIIYRSAAMEEVLELADRVAASSASVLITGESGTGKELIARRIHARSARSEGPFVPVSCAAIPSELLEAELFGHERGAFTGAVQPRVGKFRHADGGTLFLDEIAELPLPAQAKLLRVVQESAVDVLGADQPTPIDVRIVAATNKDLAAHVEDATFREDLYFRLDVVRIHVPPLRARPEDITALVPHFVSELAPDREIEIPNEVLEQLARRRWAGNVRELRNACERMALLSPKNILSTDSLAAEPEREVASPAADTSGWPALPEDGLSLLDLERSVIERVLADKGGNISEAARYLKVPRHFLVYRIEKYGIVRPSRK